MLVFVYRGGMIFTFYKAEGLQVGKSLVEEDQLELARKVKQTAKDGNVEFILPVDVVLADTFAEDANTKIADVTSIPEGWMVSPVFSPQHCREIAVEAPNGMI